MTVSKVVKTPPPLFLSLDFLFTVMCATFLETPEASVTLAHIT